MVNSANAQTYCFDEVTAPKNVEAATSYTIDDILAHICSASNRVRGLIRRAQYAPTNLVHEAQQLAVGQVVYLDGIYLTCEEVVKNEIAYVTLQLLPISDTSAAVRVRVPRELLFRTMEQSLLWTLKPGQLFVTKLTLDAPSSVWRFEGTDNAAAYAVDPVTQRKARLYFARVVTEVKPAWLSERAESVALSDLCGAADTLKQ